MSTDHHESKADDFPLVLGGPAHRLAERLGLVGPPIHRRIYKAALLMLIAWLPLAILSWLAGHADGEGVKVPFFRDPEVHTRFLFVLPLLELAEAMVAISLSVQVRHLFEGGIVPEKARPALHAARAEAVVSRESVFAEAMLVALSYFVALVARLGFGLSEGGSSWERTGSSITLAGWWHTLVSLPLLYFFLLRWVWVFLLWARFLYRVSRFDLELTPTHPDRTGGLGFLGWGLTGFATVLMAVSAVVASGMVHDVMHAGESLDSLKYHVIAFVVAALVVLYAPLFAFSARLSRCRFLGLLEFGSLAWRHDRAFDAKWIENRPEKKGESILGAPDIQSLAGIGICYEHVERMRLIPFDAKAFVVLVLAALLPMLPLVGTEIPLKEIFLKLGELLV